MKIIQFFFNLDFNSINFYLIGLNLGISVTPIIPLVVGLQEINIQNSSIIRILLKEGNIYKIFDYFFINNENYIKYTVNINTFVEKLYINNYCQDNNYCENNNYYPNKKDIEECNFCKEKFFQTKRTCKNKNCFNYKK